MNPRFFCREPQYENAIILTYSFDPIFFENVVLPDLWASGVGNIIVIGDKDEIDVAVAKTKGKINQLGRSYRIIKSKTVGIQHSKLILKTGKSDAMLWIGSGNVTSGGWGLNNEIATAWQIEKNDAIGNATIGYIRNAIANIIGGITPEIDSVYSPFPSSSEKGIGKTSFPILISYIRPLAEQLLERWAGKSFERVKILTGSTDKNGALLKWLAENFGVKEAIIGISPEQSSFDPKILSKLPLEIKILPMPFLPINHAKFIWFEGNSGCRAVMGSANCSAAAWLVPPKSGGNIETIAVYDECNNADFEEILSKFLSTELADPKDVLSVRPDDVGPIDKINTHGINIENIQLIRETETVLVTLTKPISGGVLVELEIDDSVIPLHLQNKEDTQWTGNYHKPSNALHTLFGRLNIKINGTVEHSSWQWIDDNDELRHAAKGKQIINTLCNITETLSSNEQKQFVRDIAHVLDVIFTNTPEFRDIPSFTKHVVSKTTDIVKPLDPDEIVKSLHDIHSSVHLSIYNDESSHISLFGIMRYIFSIQDSATDDVMIGDAEDEDVDVIRRNVGFHKRQPNEIEREEKQKRRFIEQIDKGIINLFDKGFAGSCTATQLVHAVATLLVLSIKGADGNWLTRESSSKYIQRILDVLLLLKINGAEGMLSLIRNRYRANNQSNIYESIIGSGELWLVIISALYHLQSTPNMGSLDKALYIRDVYETSDLRLSLRNQDDIKRLRILMTRLNLIYDPDIWLLECRDITRNIKRIESILASNKDHLLKLQLGGDHNVGDLLWHPNGGFAMAEQKSLIADNSSSNLSVYLRFRGDSRLVRSSLYVNLRIACKHLSELSNLLTNIQLT